MLALRMRCNSGRPIPSHCNAAILWKPRRTNTNVSTSNTLLNLRRSRALSCDHDISALRSLSLPQSTYRVIRSKLIKAAADSPLWDPSRPLPDALQTSVPHSINARISTWDYSNFWEVQELKSRERGADYAHIYANYQDRGDLFLRNVTDQIFETYLRDSSLPVTSTTFYPVIDGHPIFRLIIALRMKLYRRVEYRLPPLANASHKYLSTMQLWSKERIAVRSADDVHLAIQALDNLTRYLGDIAAEDPDLETAAARVALSIGAREVFGKRSKNKEDMNPKDIEWFTDLCGDIMFLIFQRGIKAAETDSAARRVEGENNVESIMTRDGDEATNTDETKLSNFLDKLSSWEKELGSKKKSTPGPSNLTHNATEVPPRENLAQTSSINATDTSTIQGGNTKQKSRFQIFIETITGTQREPIPTPEKSQNELSTVFDNPIANIKPPPPPEQSLGAAKATNPKSRDRSSSVDKQLNWAELMSIKSAALKLEARRLLIRQSRLRARKLAAAKKVKVKMVKTGKEVRRAKKAKDGSGRKTQQGKSFTKTPEDAENTGEAQDLTLFNPAPMTGSQLWKLENINKYIATLRLQPRVSRPTPAIINPASRKSQFGRSKLRRHPLRQPTGVYKPAPSFLTYNTLGVPNVSWRPLRTPSAEESIKEKDTPEETTAIKKKKPFRLDNIPNLGEILDSLASKTSPRSSTIFPAPVRSIGEISMTRKDIAPVKAKLAREDELEKALRRQFWEANAAYEKRKAEGDVDEDGEKKKEEQLNSLKSQMEDLHESFLTRKPTPQERSEEDIKDDGKPWL